MGTDSSPLDGAPEAAQKTYTFNLSFSLTGPDLAKSGVFEYIRSLGRREISVIGGFLLFVFLIEPVVLYLLFSAKLKSQLAHNTDILASSLAAHISTEVSNTVRDQLARTQNQVTPLKGSDTTSLVISPNTSTPPRPTTGKP
ncbi:MAG TPA: hypothetical protein DCZ01_08960 [Elusimicrobia bacterium]|nr:MAG: hypothetical protein A2X37_02420 [Elusimicrobia bacterium GWA2_66_18]OGR76255.1 MAG: hypothetical protein A2X40_11775 [Elusimicrobia bacterium GWC2_65_9]HAZ08632.1 hypothetical protein [Elusimicrobiota bacterium]